MAIVFFNDRGNNDIVAAVAVASSKLHNGCGHDENGNGDDDDNDSINIKSSNNSCCIISSISSRIFQTQGNLTIYWPVGPCPCQGFFVG